MSQRKHVTFEVFGMTLAHPAAGACCFPPDCGAGLQADPEHRGLQLQRDERPAGREVCPQWGE